MVVNRTSFLSIALLDWTIKQKRQNRNMGYVCVFALSVKCEASHNNMQWSRNEFHVGGAIFIFLVAYNFSANKACRRCFLLPSTKIAIQV